MHISPSSPKLWESNPQTWTQKESWPTAPVALIPIIDMGLTLLPYRISLELGVSLRNQIRNVEICRRTRVTDIAQRVEKLKWQWAGHILLRKNGRWGPKVLEWQPRTEPWNLELEECRRWDPQRHTLIAEIGGDLSLSSVVFAMLSSERSWKAVVDFCEEVISQKEAAERMREEAVNAHPLRRRRGGRRRREYAARLLALGGGG
ncbi:jg8915 [Pararge aegeria aegeria]|uniref:Jg8915 protein n=1 Tax=Pararge aegeria aegeria TaxID=348720 RepID=A0A8S4SDY3_9NEOP|nr:jg8915 [Pararge aegeria aegeria]